MCADIKCDLLQKGVHHIRDSLTRLLRVDRNRCHESYNTKPKKRQNKKKM